MFFSVVILSVCICGLFMRYLNKSCPNNVKLYPGCIPVIGHIWSILRTNIFHFIEDVGAHTVINGGISAVNFCGKMLYVTTNVEYSTTVLTKCLEKPFVYKYIEPLFGDTLVWAEVTVWKRNRRILDLAFKQQILDGYMHVFNSQAARLVQDLDKRVGEYIDVTDDITRNVLETTCQTTMGMRKDGESCVNEKYVGAVHKVFEIATLRVQKCWLIFDAIFNRTSYKDEQDASLKIIHEVSAKMVEIRKSEYLERLNENDLANNQERIQSFLEIIIENSSTPDGSIYTDHQLRCLCDNVLLAGFDTTTYELLFTLICIGSDSAVQDKIYKEIIDVMGEEETLTRHHLTKLMFLEAAIKEALRLYPIAPIIARDTTTDLQLGEVKIPAGSPIVVHLWAINRNEQYWKNATKYIPERWLEPATLPEHPNAFASFSFGRRNCIGKNYALLHMKSTLAHVVRRYRIASDHTKMEFECFAMLKVKAGHLVKLELR